MVFAGLTAVIAKAGLKNVSADAGLAVRTCFVFVFVWINVFIFNQHKDFSNLTMKDTALLGVSALTTSLSWIFYYKAISDLLQLNYAPEEGKEQISNLDNELEKDLKGVEPTENPSPESPSSEETPEPLAANNKLS